MRIPNTMLISHTVFSAVKSAEIFTLFRQRFTLVISDKIAKRYSTDCTVIPYVIAVFAASVPQTAIFIFDISKTR